MSDNSQLLVILFNKDKDPNEENFINLAVAKKKLPDTNITLVVATGYEGGGCYSDFCGAYLVDEYGESVLETLEECDYSDDSEEYSQEYAELHKFMYTSIYYNEDDDRPELNEELRDQVGERTIELNWDWDDEAHIEASQNWAMYYRW